MHWSWQFSFVRDYIFCKKSKFQPLANGTCFIIEYAINLLSKGSFSFKSCLNFTSFRLLPPTKTKTKILKHVLEIYYVTDTMLCSLLKITYSQN